jgi:hypothetical protein
MSAQKDRKLEFLDSVAMMWLLYRSGVLDKLREMAESCPPNLPNLCPAPAPTADTKSNRNTSKNASTAGKRRSGGKKKKDA